MGSAGGLCRRFMSILGQTEPARPPALVAAGRTFTLGYFRLADLPGVRHFHVAHPRGSAPTGIPGQVKSAESLPLKGEDLDPAMETKLISVKSAD
jgi:hypothetical protein